MPEVMGKASRSWRHLSPELKKTETGDEHFRQVSTAAALAQSHENGCLIWGAWHLEGWGGLQRGGEAVQAGQGQARKSLAFDPILSAFSL